VTMWDVSETTRPLPLGTLPQGRSVSADVSRSAILVGGAASGRASLINLSGLGDVIAYPLRQGCLILGGGLDPAEWATYAEGVPYHASCA